MYNIMILYTHTHTHISFIRASSEGYLGFYFSGIVNKLSKHCFSVAAPVRSYKL